MNTKTLTEEERESSGGTLFAILLIIACFWGGFQWLGISMESFNALFSGLAFATLIFTALLQRRELRLQRKELAATRKELKRSAKAQKASKNALRAQAEATRQMEHLNRLNSLLTCYNNEITHLLSLRLESREVGAVESIRRKKDQIVKEIENMTGQ